MELSPAGKGVSVEVDSLLGLEDHGPSCHLDCSLVKQPQAEDSEKLCPN